MASPKDEGFLTEEQREMLRIAAQKAEALSSSPRSKAGIAETHAKGARNVRRTRSGKLVRVKKGE